MLYPHLRKDWKHQYPIVSLVMFYLECLGNVLIEIKIHLILRVSWYYVLENQIWSGISCKTKARFEIQSRSHLWMFLDWLEPGDLLPDFCSIPSDFYFNLRPYAQIATLMCPQMTQRGQNYYKSSEDDGSFTLDDWSFHWSLALPGAACVSGWKEAMGDSARFCLHLLAQQPNLSVELEQSYCQVRAKELEPVLG